MEKGLNVFIDMLFRLISGKPQLQEKYDADFESPHALLSRRFKGFCMTGTRNLSIKNSYINAIAVGGTGTGKSSAVLIPSIMRMNTSGLVIHDPAGELHLKTSGYLKEQGYDVRVLNFADVSDGYNPLSRVRSSSDAMKVAHTLLQNSLGSNSKDTFWNTLAESLIAMLIMILLEQEREYQCLANVRHLLNLMGSKPEAIDTLFSRSSNNALYNEYASFLSYDQKVVSGVLATCKAALQLFSDDTVARVTSVDTIDFEVFRQQQRTALFVQTKIAEQSYFSPIVALFFEQLFAFIMSKLPQEGERDVFLLIDETTSIKLPTLQMAVANVRKHNCGIMLVVQDYNQLIHIYGRYETEAILSNCFAKLYFTNQSPESAQKLEQILGKHEFIDDKGTKRTMPLMTSDRIRTMPIDKALLLCGHHKPVMVKLRPYYKTYLHSHSKLSPVTPNGKVPDTVPLLPLADKGGHLQAI